MSSENKNLETALYNYFEVVQNKRLSKSKLASMIDVKIGNGIESLWIEHESISKEFHEIYRELSTNDLNQNIRFSYLDLKIKIAEKIFKNCHFCEKKCLVNRNLDIGFCGVSESKITSEFIHLGEERPLVPSHTIFFAGCTFTCVYCQNWEISQYPESGIIVKEKNLASIIDMKRKKGSRNVNFVGGDPTPNLVFILKTVKLCKENIPVIWNSNFYMSNETMKLLDGFVDLFLTDFKYGNDICAEKFSGIKNYWNIITRNHEIGYKAADMIIRHLVLPNHIECCSKPILKWIYHNLGKETVINIMGQYRPTYKAFEYEDIARFPYAAAELENIVEYAKGLGFINIIF
jgi:putative pyruvate formate lyase activating enzyme